MVNFEQYLRKSGYQAAMMDPQRSAELKRLKVAKEVAKGPPYNCARNEGKRMGIQESMKKQEEQRMQEARQSVSPLKATVKFSQDTQQPYAQS